jgi:hypothetical protein
MTSRRNEINAPFLFFLFYFTFLSAVYLSLFIQPIAERERGSDRARARSTDTTDCAVFVYRGKRGGRTGGEKEEEVKGLFYV